MWKCCIICFRKVEECPVITVPTLDNKYNEDHRQLVKRFFRLLGRYLDDKKNGSGGRRRRTGSLHQFAPVSKMLKEELFSSCDDCAKIMMEFCGLYNEMKVVELQMHWKLWTIGRIMKCARKVPSRVKSVQESVEQLTISEQDNENADEIVKSIVEFKEDLGKRCNQKMLGGYPKLTLHRYETPTEPEEGPLQLSQPETKEVDRVIPEQYQLISFEQINDNELLGEKCSAIKSNTQTENLPHQKFNCGSTSMKSTSSIKQSRTRSTRKRLLLSRLKLASDKVKARYAGLVRSGSAKKNSISENLPVIANTETSSIGSDIGDIIGDRAVNNASTEENINATHSEFHLSDSDNDNLIEVFNSGLGTVPKMRMKIEKNAKEEVEPLPENTVSDDIVESQNELLTLKDNCEETNHSDFEPVSSILTTVADSISAADEEVSAIAELANFSVVRKTSAVNDIDNAEIFSAENELSPTDTVLVSAVHPIDIDNTYAGRTIPEAEMTVNSPNLPEQKITTAHECTSTLESEIILEEKASGVHNLLYCTQTTDAPSEEILQSGSNEDSTSTQIIKINHASLSSSCGRPSRLRQVHRCDKCGRTFSSQASFQNHLKSHNSEPFPATRADVESDEDSFSDCGLPSTDSENYDSEDDNDHLDKKETIPFLSNSDSKRIAMKQKIKRRVYTKSSKSKVFPCDVPTCSKIFFTSKDYKTHKKLHGTFPCLFCESVLEYAPDVAMHELIHHSDINGERKLQNIQKIYKCPRHGCNYLIKSKRIYISHYVAVHMKLSAYGKSRVCGICGAVFLTLAQYNLKKQREVHYNRHHNLSRVSLKDTFQCDEEGCSAYFLKHVQLETHKARGHGGCKRRNHNCVDCNKHFGKVDELKLHRIKEHQVTEADFKFVCSKEGCGKRFETKVNLKNHLVFSHSRRYDKIVQCSKCNKPCKGEGALKVHMKTHNSHDKVPGSTKEKKLVCEKCGKRFMEKIQLNIHYLSHSGPDSWEYMCNVCSKKCISKQKLDEHMRTHTKEKPFVCEVCGEKYAHRHNLRIHVNNKHSDVGVGKDTNVDGSQSKSRKGVKRKKAEDETPTTSSD